MLKTEKKEKTSIPEIALDNKDLAILRLLQENARTADMIATEIFEKSNNFIFIDFSLNKYNSKQAIQKPYPF